ncbi:uncharacterized protein [Panulirus ornatus]|uniref:uncharacterized protein n=1 Tax=Panulirus ornatus TaxID=150431 RepID=UPI003A8524A3
MAGMRFSDYKQPYRGKEGFLRFLDEYLDYDEHSKNMISKEDLIEAYGCYCREHNLYQASIITLGHHLRGVGVVVQRFGPAKKQRYCYGGFSWKVSEYETLTPTKRGRKRKYSTGERPPRKKPSWDTGEKRDYLKACVGDLAPCALEWNGKEVIIRRRNRHELRQALAKVVASGAERWWENKSLQCNVRKEPVMSDSEKTKADLQQQALCVNDDEEESQEEDSDESFQLSLYLT